MPDNAHTFTGHSSLPHVGTYRRRLHVSIARMYENTLDWEHLPFLHASAFSAIDCLDAGPWGWRASVVSVARETSTIELVLDRALHRWITRILEGRYAGAEVWTHVFELGKSEIEVVVDFFVPGLDPLAREKVGAAFVRSYAALYDEDEQMMTARERLLATRVEGVFPDAVQLGVRAELVFPLVATVAKRRFVVAEHQGELFTYPAECPHLMGPLDRGVFVDGAVTCPWHGYRFDVASGDCLSGSACRFGERPRVSERDGIVVVGFP